MKSISIPLMYCVTVAIATIAVGLMSSPVNAAALLSDDFDNLWPSDWTRKWNAVSDPSNNGIRTDPADPNNLVLKLYGVQNWSASATRSVAFSDNFVVTASVWNGSEPRSAGWGRGSVALEDVTSLFTFYAGGIYPNGTLNLGGIELPYETEQWYDVRVLYQHNNGNPTGRYWLDGVYVGETQLTIGNPGAAPTRLELNGGSTAYFDNVSVMSVPEPASLLLMMLGAVGVAWRSRRAARRAS